MPHEFKAGDRVRVTRAVPVYYPQPGWIGVYVKDNDDDPEHGKCVLIQWGDVPHPLCRDRSTRVPVCILEPAPAAQPSQAAIVQRAIAHEQPAAAVRVCSSECDAVRDELDEMRNQRDQLQLKLAEVTGLKHRAGDIIGERDALRNRCAELEASLSEARRELARRGRK